MDLWAGWILLRLKEQPEYSEIQLMIALPFEGHDASWDERSKKRLAFLVKHSTKTVVVGTKEAPPSGQLPEAQRVYGGQRWLPAGGL